MNVPALGPLHADVQFPEWLVSAPVSVPYFDGQTLEFTLEALTDADEPEARSAVDAFLALDVAARRSASPYVFQNYRKMADAVGANQMDCRVAVPEEVWAHVQPTGVVVSLSATAGTVPSMCRSRPTAIGSPSMACRSSTGEAGSFPA